MNKKEHILIEYFLKKSNMLQINKVKIYFNLLNLKILKIFLSFLYFLNKFKILF